MLGKVKGGTDAGKRMHRAGTETPKHDWTCAAGHRNPRYAAKCLTPRCRARRGG